MHSAPRNLSLPHIQPPLLYPLYPANCALIARQLRVDCAEFVSPNPLNTPNPHKTLTHILFSIQFNCYKKKSRMKSRATPRFLHLPNPPQTHQMRHMWQASGESEYDTLDLKPPPNLKP